MKRFNPLNSLSEKVCNKNMSPSEVKSTKKVNVLILDDVNLMCQFLSETLRPISGVECHTAARVASAAGVLERVAVSLAIIDLNLPDGNGIEIVKAIRKGEGKGAHDIPILIFSGNTYKEAVTECVQFKVNDFIVKPIIAMELRKKVEAHLKKPVELPGCEYFQKLDAELMAKKPKEPSVKPTSSVVQSKTPQSSGSYSSKKRADEIENNQFLKWPANATTGFHQLDRRLKDLCYQLNHFHFYRTHKPVYPTAQKDIEQISLCIDDLNYAVKPLKKANPDLAIWQALQNRVKMISELPFKRLSADKITEDTGKAFSKNLRNAWLAILSKPIIQRKKG